MLVYAPMLHAHIMPKTLLASVADLAMVLRVSLNPPFADNLSISQAYGTVFSQEI